MNIYYHNSYDTFKKIDHPHYEVESNYFYHLSIYSSHPGRVYYI